MTPRTKVERDEVIDRLTEAFRTVGYEGATLSMLADATGLEKASLYHRFPGGKQEMAEAVLAAADQWLREHVLEPLRSSAPPKKRLNTMAHQLDAFYAGGKQPCLLNSLSLGNKDNLFQEHIANAFKEWMAALSQVLREAGYSKKRAEREAEQAIASIEGALVMARGTGSTDPFRRVLCQLPERLMANK